MTEWQVSPQKPGCVDENIRFVVLDGASLVHLHLPFSFIVIPDGLGDTGVKLDVFVKIPLFHGSLDVLLDLGTRGVEMRPIGIGFEQKCIAIYRYQT